LVGCGFVSEGESDVWLVAGPIEHWRFGLKNGIWGAHEGMKNRWGEDPREGDIFFAVFETYLVPTLSTLNKMHFPIPPSAPSRTLTVTA